MSDIAYVCLSDTHLGDTNSLLTNLQAGSGDGEPLAPSPVLEQLVTCLRTLFDEREPGADTAPQRPVLILNGDILEMALANTDEAAMAFLRFIELCTPATDPLFERMVYIPGNHDHHLWETVRETQYIKYLWRKFRGKADKEVLPAPWHVTQMFELENQKHAGVRCEFLEKLIKLLPGNPSLEVKTFYPNYGLLTEDRSRCVVFHHGQFIEPLYALMSGMRSVVFPESKPPHDAAELETENFAWIDFFWSVMGRSGRVGESMELLYEIARDPRARRHLVRALSRNVSERYGPLLKFKWLDTMALRFLTKKALAYVDEIERAKKLPRDARLPLSEKAIAGLRDYTETMLRHQMMDELYNTMPPYVTMVFGHVHKPFVHDMGFEGFPQWVETHNTGGWVVDSVQPEHIRGAAITVFDKQLNAASIECYREHDDLERHQVRVVDTERPDASAQAFRDQVRARLKRHEAEWTLLSERIDDAVALRRANLRDELTAWHEHAA